MQPRIGWILLARMDSARLPGKPLADAAGKPLLDRVLDRLERRTCGGEVILATTDRPIDRPLIDWAGGRAVRVHAHAGPVDDVAGRFAAASGGLDWAGRVNGDSPFVEPELFDRAVDAIGPGVDLITNLHPRSYPYGVAVELLRVSAFARLEQTLSDPADREHLTRAPYREWPDERILNISSETPADSGIRLTVDTPADLARFRRFLEGAGRQWPITTADCALKWYLDEKHR